MPADVAVDAATVARLAALARLPVDAAEAGQLARQMAGILAHMSTLTQAAAATPAAGGGGDVTTASDHSDADAAAAPLPPLRADVPRPCLGREAALAAAPERLGDGFGVPKIIA